MPADPAIVAVIRELLPRLLLALHRAMESSSNPRPVRALWIIYVIDARPRRTTWPIGRSEPRPWIADGKRAHQAS